MTQEEINKLIELLTPDTVQGKMGARLNTLAWVESQKPTESVKTPRTDSQNKAMHVFFNHVAKALNEAGLSVTEVLSQATELDWTEYRVKELLWKKSLKKLYGKDSTTQMKKTEEIDNVYEHINRFLSQGFVKNDTGERVFIESIEFPNSKNKESTLKHIKIAKSIPYDNHYQEPTI